MLARKKFQVLPDPTRCGTPKAKASARRKRLWRAVFGTLQRWRIMAHHDAHSQYRGGAACDRPPVCVDALAREVIAGNGTENQSGSDAPGASMGF